MKKRWTSLASSERKTISSIVDVFNVNRDLVATMLDQLVLVAQGNRALMRHVHSLRWRVKDPEHLREKLVRKLMESKEKGTDFDVTADNLFEKINDLAGFRILHLHTTQIKNIDTELRSLFEEHRFEIIEEPKARTWDIEYRDFYQSVGIATVDSPRMYTSVHYVVSSNSRKKLTCEVQVRTLAEELWGEVDHTMNYPQESPVESCREQIKVLARVTSSCSRLVDSIFRESNQKNHGGRKTPSK
jgi:putative GTP pyrophosphokinase